MSTFCRGLIVLNLRGGPMGMVSKTLIAVAALMLSALPALRSAHASPYSWAQGLPGCDPSRPAVAHHANQQVLPHQPQDGPVPCGVLTGWPAVENRIEVTNTEAVIYEPAILPALPGVGGSGHVPGPGRPLGLARTFDEGSAWQAFPVPEVIPDNPAYPASQVDNNLYVDHDTGRLFLYMYSPQYGGPPKCAVPYGNPATIGFSDDSGTTWSNGNDIDHGCAENPTILTGKPRVAEQLSYPNVVYLCGDNTSSGAATLGTPGFSCSKSLTGGSTWLGTTLHGQGFYSGLAKDNLDPYAQCAGASSSAGAGVQPLPDGTLLVVVTCGGKTYMSKSTDEGATWNIQNQIPHGGSLRADSVGNLYLIETNPTSSGLGGGGASKILLSHSIDGGATWSPELNLIAPGVASAGTHFFAQGTFAAGQVGHVAVTYYGIRTGKTTSDGFITETRDALDYNPVFWSGQVNNPNRPLLFNTTGANTGITVLDFNGGALSPDGRSVWASFVQDCGTNMLTDPNCQSRWPQDHPADPDDGFAGRLVWPP